MLITFGATFFGVILSFILWFGGEWWIKHRKEQKALKHITREIHEEIALNINILADLVASTPKTLTSGNIPLFFPQRLNLAVFNYLTSSGELRLLEVSKQRWILNAGNQCERFNKFIENTELVLTALISHPDGLKHSIHRLEMLAEQAEETARNLSAILEKLDSPEVDYQKNEEKLTNQKAGEKANRQNLLSFSKREFVTTGVLFFLFSLTLYIYGGTPFVFKIWDFSWQASDLVSTTIIWLTRAVLIIGSVISLFCLIGGYSAKAVNKLLNGLASHEKLMRQFRYVFTASFAFAFLLNFYASWVQKLSGVAKNEVLFIVVFVIGIIWTGAIIHSEEGKKRTKDVSQQAKDLEMA